MSWRKNLVLHSFSNIYLEKNKEGKWKKKMNGLLPKWSELTQSNIKKGDLGICCNTGKVSGVLVLDFDNIKVWEEWLEMFPILEDVPRVETRHGFHTYWEWLDKYAVFKKDIKNPNGEAGNIDIQGNGKMVFYPDTVYQLEQGAKDGDEFTYKWDANEYEDLIELPEEMFKYIISKQPADKGKPLNSTTKKPFSGKQEVDYAIVKLIDRKKYLGDGCFNDWTKIMWGLRNEGFEKEFALEISDFKGANFNQEDFDKVWEGTTKKDEITMGTLKYYAKLSVGEEIYYKTQIDLISKYIFEPTDDGLAQLALELCGNCCAWFNNNIMTYTNGRWYNDPELYYARNLIGIKLREYFSRASVLYSVYNKFITDKDLLEKNLKIRHSIGGTEVLIQKTNWKNNIVKEFKEKIINQFKKIDFDGNGYIIAFENSKYDFKTKKFEPILKDDYISMTTRYDWEEPTEEQVAKIAEIFNKTFPNKEILKCKLSLLMDCCIGKQKDNFEVDNGAGGNGKGIVNGLMATLLGDYFMNGNLSVLLEKRGNGASPDIAVMDKKRMILFKEPNSTDKLKLGNIKQLCDCPTISGRKNYGDPFDVVLWGTLVMEVNKKLNFDGAVGEAERRRFIDLEFQASFKKPEEYKKFEDLDNVFLADDTLNTDEFKKTHACALFRYIIDNAPAKVYIPVCVKERTEAYIDSQDDYLTWINREYVYEKGKEQYITLAKMYLHYKCSEEYEKLFKKDKPLSSQFKKDIAEHSYFKMFYKERHQIPEDKEKKIGKVDVRQVLIGWRRKTDEEGATCLIEETDEE
jgi:phage/plasmid-associated DNA primase